MMKLTTNLTRRIEIKMSHASFLIDNNRNHDALPLFEQVLTTYNLILKSAQRFNRQWKERATVLKQQITQQCALLL